MLCHFPTNCVDADSFVNAFTPEDCFSSIQNNELKSPLKLLSVERVNISFNRLLVIITSNYSTRVERARTQRTEMLEIYKILSMQFVTK